MRDAAGKVLYVGKAKNLKNRLVSYFRGQLELRIHQMVAKIANIEVTVTNSEKEALLLENSLIHSLNPHYNVIFRDDKSYPFLFLSKHLYPRLIYFRGNQKSPGQYFGPYPSVAAVRETLTLLQKLFMIRQCDDVFFNNRSRPCLQYQIKRCSAPCVNYISPEEYATGVENVKLFLQGKESTIISDLVEKMSAAAKLQNYEIAAHLRDQITSLRNIYDEQIVYQQKGNADVIALVELRGLFCIQLLYIRQGKILDSQSIFPKQTAEASPPDILRAFILQFYLDQDKKVDYPREIIINHPIDDQALMAESITQNVGHRVAIINAQKGTKVQWLKMAEDNAMEVLKRRIAHKGKVQRKWEALKKELGLTLLERIECFDISHTQGEATVASCVVFNIEGAAKKEYRYYNMEVPASDDYAAMEQVLSKRYIRLKELEKPMPSIIMVDGGKGQLNRAKKAVNECQLLDVLLIGIAKGAGRKPGLETLYVTRSQSEEALMLKLPPTSPALHLLQQIRDEAHRFAISRHRKKHAKTRKTSPLESIKGIGPKRRQLLINYFGGLAGLQGASQSMIADVPGIGSVQAALIYAALHKN